MSIGLDAGTMFLVKSQEDDLVNSINFSLERNVFLQAATTDDTEDTLKDNNWAYVKYEDNYYLLGEDALRLKNLLTVNTHKGDDIVITKVGDLRRPMRRGILNTSEEKLSIAIIQKLIENLIGKPSFPGEALCFCVPGDPVDNNLSVLFHQSILSNFLQKIGYTVECIPEALAIIFSEAPSATTEDGEEPFTGLAISCLPPGQKVITREGLVNIEEIEKGQEVWTHKGRWQKVIKPTSRHYSGKILTFESQFGKTLATTTEDHEWYVYADNTWQWVKAKDIRTNDVVGIKCPNAFEHEHTYPFISTYEKKTNSKPVKKVFSLGQKGMRFLGYFLADGCLVRHDNEINFDFSNNEQNQIIDIQNLSSELFKRKVWTHKANGRTRCRFGFNGLANWLREHCYRDHDKIFPFDITRMNKSQILGLLQGLWLGDGNHNSNGNTVQFYNSSSELVAAFYLGCLTLGFSPTIYEGDIDKESKIDNRIVSLTKQPYTVHIGGYEASKLKDMLLNGRTFADKSFMDSYMCVKIGNIHEEEFNDVVFDMQVENDHSFCLPGITLHNCGSGMTNFCFAYRKMPLISFSITRGGDWIDLEASKIAGVNVSAMTRYKESKFDLNNVDYSNMKDAALDIFYNNMIEHAIEKFSEQFGRLDIEDQVNAPLEIVIAGGTASVPGFLNKFKSVLDMKDLNFRVKGVRLAENPLYTVSSGCLAKAMSMEKKIKEKASAS